MCVAIAGADLSGIAVYGLHAAEDQIGRELLQSLCNRIRCSPCVRTSKRSVGEENPIVSTESNGLAKRGLRLGRAHGENGYGRLRALLG